MKEIHSNNPFPKPEASGSEIHISDYLDILYKRKNFILLFFILVLLIVIYRTNHAVPLYSASTQLVIEPKSLQSPVTGKRIEFESNVSQLLDLKTHFKLIKSKPVIKSVVSSLALEQEKVFKKKPDIFRIIKQAVRERIVSLFIPPGKTESVNRGLDPTTRKMNGLIKRVQAGVKVTQIEKTRLIQVSVTNPDPVLAANISNAVAKKYIEFDLASQLESSKKNLEWLNRELYELTKELEDNERAFFEYKTRNKVFSMEGKQKVAGQKIAEFNTRYLEVRNKRLDLDSKINELKRHLKTSKGLVKVRSLINNELIENVYSKIVDLEIQLTKLSKTFKSRHPKIIQVKSEIEKSQRRLDIELKKELANLKSERSVIAAREKVLEKTISEFEQDALDSSSKELTYTILQRKVKTSQHLYDILLSRIKESDILKNQAASNIRIVEQAAISPRPVYPRKFRNLTLGFFFGLMGGCILAYFLEYMDQTLRTQEDVQSYLNLPVLSVIPEADK